MSRDAIFQLLSQLKPQLHREYGVKWMGVFGSILRGEATETSDVDLLVEFDRGIGLLKFLELEDYLAGQLGTEVDLVTRRSLKPHIARRILEEVVPV